MAITLQQLARLLFETDQAEEAEQLCREALAIQRKTIEPTHPRTLGSAALLARILAGRNDWTGAEAAYRELIELRRLAYVAGDLRITMAQIELAQCLQELDRFEEAEPLLQGGLRRFETERGQDHSQTNAVRTKLAALYEAWGKPQPQP